MSTIDLSMMNSVEKIELMERLWVSFDKENYVSPEWHRDILRERLSAVKKGDAVFSSIEEVKERLYRSLNEN